MKGFELVPLLMTTMVLLPLILHCIYNDDPKWRRPVTEKTCMQYFKDDPLKSMIELPFVIIAYGIGGMMLWGAFLQVYGLCFVTWHWLVG